MQHAVPVRCVPLRLHSVMPPLSLHTSLSALVLGASMRQPMVYLPLSARAYDLPHMTCSLDPSCALCMPCHTCREQVW